MSLRFRRKSAPPDSRHHLNAKLPASYLCEMSLRLPGYRQVTLECELTSHSVGKLPASCLYGPLPDRIRVAYSRRGFFNVWWLMQLCFIFGSFTFRQERMSVYDKCHDKLDGSSCTPLHLWFLYLSARTDERPGQMTRQARQAKLYTASSSVSLPLDKHG
jgi:hypothetical protein